MSRQVSEIHCRKCAGFTLVELLVVIAIIGILIALLLPAVQAAREAARRTQCSNNLKQIALAVHNYENGYQLLPPGSIGWGTSVTWAARILPYLEQSALYELVDYEGEVYYTGTNSDLMMHRIATYTCPSDTPQTRAQGWTKYNYVGNFGNTGFRNTGFYGAEANYNGVTFEGAPFTLSGSYPHQGWPNIPHRFVSVAHIRDGLSNTMLYSEAVQGQTPPPPGVLELRGFIWWGYGSMFTTYLPPNAAQPDVYQNPNWCDSGGLVAANPPCIGPETAAQPMTNAARSRHSGGVQAAQCDGSVRFITDNISLNIWRALSTTQGGESLDSTWN